MRGSIVKRGEKFHAVLDLPRGADGKRKQKWLSGYPTRREAEAALAHALNEVHTGRYVEPTAMTVRQFLCDEWLPASAARVRATTLRGYRQLIDSYAVPAVGDVPLADVTPVVLTKLYGRLLTSGRANGKGGLSARTVRFLHTVLRRAFADAVRWRYLAANPADGATPPSHAAARAPEMRTWTLAELQAFLRFTADDEYHVGYVLAACCGLRRGEVCGLRWSDVDLDGTGQFGPHLRVRQTLVEVDYVVTVSGPKTAKSRRVVALDPTVVAVLRRHRTRQHKDRLACGPAYADRDLVLARADGAPVQPSNFVQVFARRVGEAGVPHIRFHDLRHTHATLSLQAGIHPKIVSERLGHASAAFTLDTYSHALPSLQAEAAATFGALVAGLDR
ncbi:MAG TPA: tyrosine-type recombinase/integrase [Frankiaceae bacterium]|nr:tyrosine-type recombinase/integrase [Frankiaceae bacterium]